jgi:hypothetical protein
MGFEIISVVERQDAQQEASYALPPAEEVKTQANRHCLKNLVLFSEFGTRCAFRVMS